MLPVSRSSMALDADMLDLVSCQSASEGSNTRPGLQFNPDTVLGPQRKGPPLDLVHSRTMRNYLLRSAS
jgi:hypothetical protein